MRFRLWIALLAVICTVSCDRLTKDLATSTLRHAPPRSYFSDTLRLQYVENEGAFLGLGGNLDSAIRFWLFTVGSGATLVGVGFWVWRHKRMRLGDTIALSLLMGGGMGNLVDRIVLDGRVVDFLNLGVGPVRTGIFNVADLAIMGGVVLLALQLARPEGPNHAESRRYGP